MKRKIKLGEYNHAVIEKKAKKYWNTNNIYKTEQKSKKKPYYVLDMFPYPSGAGLHVGHPRGYIGSDVFARFKRMNGFNVLHPMGFDAFGLPAEQYAIQTGKHPSIITKEAIKRYKKQLEQIGFSYDWDREIQTINPEYYKWTQVIFLKIYNSFYDIKKAKARHIDELLTLFEREGNSKVNDYTAHSDVGVFTKTDWKNFSPKEKQDVLMKYRMAYEGHAEVNWCKELGTVLANDEVLEKDGKLVSERGDFPVEKKSMRQWFMRISAYGDRLLSGLDLVDFPDSTKEVQRNWIGKSEGSEISFAIKNTQENITVFTTRADTLFGVTYVVLAPEHPLVVEMMPHMKNRAEVEQFIEAQAKKTEEERQDIKEKVGIQLLGITAINPANNEEVPVWIANYVLMNYGTGAVMAVPAHDERDFEFAKKYNLPIKDVIHVHGNADPIFIGKNLSHPNLNNKNYIEENDAFVQYGILVNSNQFDGLTSEEAKKEITNFVGGKLVTKYKMRDAIFARQRYWGEPIPLIHDKKTGLIKEVPLSKLPLTLPNVKSYKPTGTGDSPLASVKSWVDAGYETNTMPGWAASSWYFLRYMDPKNKKELVGEKAISYFKNVDMYVGGTEHNTGHLLYARFWHKVLFDLGIAKTEEPFKALRHQGMIGGSDGRKMSKRWGNVVNPDDVVATYGADTLRVFEMFLGPFNAHLPWSEDGIIGSRRFVERVWRASYKVAEAKTLKPDSAYENFIKVLHKTIKKVTEDIESFNFNTAVSAMMICLNEMEKQDSIDIKDFKLFLQILAPFASHMTDILWQSLGEKKSIHLSAWPKYNPQLIIDTQITIGVQVNGKVRGEITLALDADQKAVEWLISHNENVQRYINGPIKKIIYIPGKIINIVI